MQESQIIEQVSTIYQWLEREIIQLHQSCAACGDCCDFESFGHRLYVTTPELLHFQHHLGSKVREMSTDICPYRMDGRCTVYPFRFSGCRIFSCKGDSEKENALCEEAIKKLKNLCDKHRIPYNYVCLKIGLDMLRSDPEFKIKN